VHERDVYPWVFPGIRDGATVRRWQSGERGRRDEKVATADNCCCRSCCCYMVTMVSVMWLLLLMAKFAPALILRYIRTMRFSPCEKTSMAYSLLLTPHFFLNIKY